MNEEGQPLTYYALRGRFYNTREATGIEKAKFQFHDLGAKAGTDKTNNTAISGKRKSNWVTPA